MEAATAAGAISTPASLFKVSKLADTHSFKSVLLRSSSFPEAASVKCSLSCYRNTITSASRLFAIAGDGGGTNDDEVDDELQVLSPNGTGLASENIVSAPQVTKPFPFSICTFSCTNYFSVLSIY